MVLNHISWPPDLDLWPMTLPSTQIMDTINGRPYAKFRDSMFNGSTVSSPKLKSVGALKLHIIVTWANLIGQFALP